jgi:tetratricopeptide (TPR) repeat protein
MQLSEDAKQLIKQEVEALLREGQNKVNDLKLAKYEIKSEADELLGKQKDSLRQLDDSIKSINRYKNVLRGLAVFIFGSAIIGIATFSTLFLRFQNYLDNRIGLRVQKMDRLALSISLADSGQWGASLGELDKLRSDFKTAGFQPTEEFQSFFLVNYLRVLGQVEGRQPDGFWVGQEQWNRLYSEPDFHREFILSGKWKSNSDVNNSLGFCTLKYVKSPSVLENARQYFLQAYESAEPRARKAPHLFALAMIDLIEKNQASAVNRLKEAEELEPFWYKNSEFLTYKNSFINSTEFQIWEGVARQVNAGEFKQLYEQLVNQLFQKRSAVQRNTSRRKSGKRSRRA